MRWQTAVLGAKGALSVEFWPPAPPDQFEAVAIARFTSVDVLRTWRRGDKHRALIDEVAQLAEGGVVISRSRNAQLSRTGSKMSLTGAPAQDGLGICAKYQFN